MIPEHPLERLPAPALRRLAVAASSAALALGAVLLALGRDLQAPLAPRGLLSFELAWRAADMAALLAGWGEAGAARARLMTWLDFPFLASYGAALAALACLRPGRTAAWAATAAAACDLAENLLALMILDGGILPAALPMALFAALKFALVCVPLAWILIHSPAMLRPLLVLALAAPLCAAASTTPVRGVHLTSWIAGSAKDRAAFLDKASGTMVNAVVVPMKEFDGKVYIPGVAAAEAYGTTRKAIPDPRGLVADLHRRGLRAVARVVVFKDDDLARRRPEWAVQDERGGPWKNANGVTWVDPYRREVWDYNIEVALAAARAGFDEVQFDYIRFPSDGDTRRCRYSRVDHSSATAQAAIDAFLAEARRRLSAAGADMSIAVFGLTTTARDDMGIAQSIARMGRHVDAVSPMMYPSHYARGEYGLSDPNAEPYKVVSWGLRDAKRRLGGEAKLRPYLQDFSLGRRYGVSEVRAQLRAALRQGVRSWILWNPQNRYTWQALRPFSEEELLLEPGEKDPAAEAPAASTAPAPAPAEAPLSEEPDKEEL